MIEAREQAECELAEWMKALGESLKRQEMAVIALREYVRQAKEQYQAALRD